jgi:hypothetical protein
VNPEVKKSEQKVNPEVGMPIYREIDRILTTINQFQIVQWIGELEVLFPANHRFFSIGMYLLIKTNTETLGLHVGLVWYLEQQKLSNSTQ